MHYDFTQVPFKPTMTSGALIKSVAQTLGVEPDFLVLFKQFPTVIDSSRYLAGGPPPHAYLPGERPLRCPMPIELTVYTACFTHPDSTASQFRQ